MELTLYKLQSESYYFILWQLYRNSRLHKTTFNFLQSYTFWKLITMPVYYHNVRFPPGDYLDWKSLIPFIGPAAAALARFDGVLAAIRNQRILLTPLTTQEAVLSSRIEGTQATMGEVFQYEAGEKPSSPERVDDIQEVLNYRAAMRQAENSLKTLPLSQRVIKEAHAILMSGVRGRGKSSGEYRRSPNWIGPHDCSIDDARFVPIESNQIPVAMSNWEKYIHREPLDRLVQLAILHAEFESLHPFLDGNGRLRRMFVPLFLWQVNILHAPMFYISAYLEANRNSYYESLLAVSRDDDWTEWCKIFLEAIRVQADNNLNIAQGILDLYDSIKSELVPLTQTKYAIHALDFAFSQPIFTSTNFIRHAEIPMPTARRILKKMCEGEIFRVISKNRGSRPAVLVFPQLVNLIEGKTVF